MFLANKHIQKIQNACEAENVWKTYAVKILSEISRISYNENIKMFDHTIFFYVI